MWGTRDNCDSTNESSAGTLANMPIRPKRRWWFTLLSGVFVVVMVLNIEKFTEWIGWDRWLIYFVDLGFPWLSTALEYLTGTTALLVSIAVVAYTAGLWSERIASFNSRRKFTPFDHIVFSEKCEEMAKILHETSGIVKYGRQFYNNQYFEWRMIQMDLNNEYGTDLNLCFKSPEQIESIAVMLEGIVPIIRAARVTDVRIFVENFDFFEGKQRPEDAPTEAVGLTCI